MNRIALTLLTFLIAIPPAFGAETTKGKTAKTLKKTEKAQTPPAEKETSAPTPGNSLYDRLGGKEALKVMADEWVASAAADKQISKYFEKTDLPAFKSQWVDQVCEASGGSCKFVGKGMKETYKEMGLKEPDVKALIDDLGRVLDKMKIGKPERDELLSLLGTMQGEPAEKK
jgi:hemoglobin